MPRSVCVALLASCAAVLAACSPNRPESPADNGMIAGNAMPGDNAQSGAPVSFDVSGGDGKALGSVKLSEDPAGMMINVAASGLPEGAHGLHLHEKGLCEGPKFESAGKHWNPGAKQHGKDNPQGAHLGDLSNLNVAADGTATVSIPAAGMAMASLADADGTSLVIHAKPDDYKTDPSGASGDRIACAVLAAPTGG